MTGGTWPLATLPIHKDTEKAYRVLYETGWRPPGVQNQAQQIGKQLRAFDQDELEEYRKLRGQTLKKMIADFDFSHLDTENKKLMALDIIYETANERATLLTIKGIQDKTGMTGASPKVPVLKPRAAPLLQQQPSR